MESYYYSNGLYLDLTTPEQIKPLRNPVARIVEFYVDTLWPGTLDTGLPIVSDNDQLIEAIEQVWEWSNFESTKQLAARQFAITGNMFLKVETNGYPETETEEGKEDTKVYIKCIPAKFITDVTVDQQQHVDYLRYDISLLDDNDQSYMRTEVWDEEYGFRVWEHNRSATTKIKHLGNPLSMMSLNEVGGGIDFVPWVWAPFRDIGEGRGIPPFWSDLEKIDEVNRKATRQSQLMWRYEEPIWAVSANQVDKQGRPMKPAKFSATSNTVTVGQSKVLYLPGMTSLELLIPNINWAAFTEDVRELIAELEKDLPEMAYSRLVEEGNISGKALEYKMAPAVQRACEARGNGERAIRRADMMALTIGKNLGLDGFSGLGEYADGSLDHDFLTRPFLPESEGDRLERFGDAVKAGMPRNVAAMEYLGWDEEKANMHFAVSSADLPPQEQSAMNEVLNAKAEERLAATAEKLVLLANDTVTDSLLRNPVLERIVERGIKNAAGAAKKETPDGDHG